jgi:ribokinase
MIHVLGSINIDYSCSVKNLPRAGETIIGSKLFTTPGGKGANQAIAARRAGSSVIMTGAVGTDEIAEQALSCLTADGVDIARVARVPGPTGCAFVFVDAQSENQIVIVPGANARVSEQQAQSIDASRGDVLLLQLEVPVPVVRAAARAAHEQGAMVLANLAPYQTLPADSFAHIDVLLLNETEAQLLATDQNLTCAGGDIARELSVRLQTTVVLTLGADGVVIANGADVKSIPGIVIRAVDTVGAGDTFAGFLGSRLEHGDSLQQACETANRAAATACTKSGAQTAIPRMEALDTPL